MQSHSALLLMPPGTSNEEPGLQQSHSLAKIGVTPLKDNSTEMTSNVPPDTGRPVSMLQDFDSALKA